MCNFISRIEKFTSDDRAPKFTSRKAVLTRRSTRHTLLRYRMRAGCVIDPAGAALERSCMMAPVFTCGPLP
jgi:hypothetical protein